MSAHEQNAQLDAICLAFGEMRKKLELKPQDFPIAYERVTQGSDGTGYQDRYVQALESLIGVMDR